MGRMYKRILEAHENRHLAIFGDVAAQRLADVFYNSAKKSRDGKDESSAKDDAVRMIESHLYWLLRNASSAINETLKHDVSQEYRDGYGNWCRGRPVLTYAFVHDPVESDVNYLTHINLRYVQIPWNEKGDIPKYEDPQLNMDSNAADDNTCHVSGQLRDIGCESVSARPTPILILRRVVNIGLRNSNARQSVTNVSGFGGIPL